MKLAVELTKTHSQGAHQGSDPRIEADPFVERCSVDHQHRHRVDSFDTRDRKNPIRQGVDPRRELVYVQVAATEWDLAIEDEDDL